jgi:histidinol dehydrogenase
LVIFSPALLVILRTVGETDFGELSRAASFAVDFKNSASQIGQAGSLPYELSLTLQRPAITGNCRLPLGFTLGWGGPTMVSPSGTNHPRKCVLLMTAPAPIALDIALIDCSRENAEEQFAALRARLCPRGDVVSPTGRQRTIEVFGQPLSPQEVVERICDEVRQRGLEAVLEYTRKLDKKDLTPETLRVPPRELQDAHRRADPQYLAALRRIRDNIVEFQTRLLAQTVALVRQDGASRVELRQRCLPLRRVGICIPGGAAAYPSTLLMTAVPAQVAGVNEVAVAVPPTEFGGYNADLLAACHELDLREIYRMGGAQGVAALAYGVEGIERVDKIVGPGNLFVALAKRLVYGEVDIDSIAGPSEVVVLADESARADFIASDLIAQAEHSPGCGVLITWYPPLLDAVRGELARQLASLERSNLARQSLETYGALVLARDAEEAVRLAELMAPEHLHIATANPEELLAQVQNAGAIFLGHDTPVAVGDYFAGPSHVLPTGGTARFAHGLCADDFLKRSSVIAFNREALREAAPDIRLLAAKEGLTAHIASVDIRLQTGN